MSLSMSLARRAAIATLAIVVPTLSQGVAFGAPADLDPGFGQDGRLSLDSDLARAVALQPDGRVLVAGQVGSNTADEDGVVYRLNASGSPDVTFASGGPARLDAMNSGAYALAPRPDGKILAVGFTSSDGLVYRLNPDGSTDQTFGQGGTVALDSGQFERTYALAVQPADGKILVAGRTFSSGAGSSDLVVYRLARGGTPDLSFGNLGTARIDGGGSEAAYALAVQPDGKILVAGATDDDNNSDAVVYRLDANGTLDPDFGHGGTVTLDEGVRGGAIALALQPDGRVLVAGSIARSADDSRALVYRVTANGAPDPTFGQGGKAQIADTAINAAYTMALQPDGKILVAGAVAVAGATDVRAAVYRLDRNGSPDAGFDDDGTLHIASANGEAADALAIQPDHKIIVAGASGSGSNTNTVLYRLQGGDPPTITPRPPAATPPPATPRAPVLTRLRIAPRAFRPAAKGASAFPAARRGGALVSFTLDRAASVRFTVERAGRGRRVGGRCVRPTRSNRAKRPCTRYATLAGGFTRRGTAGANHFRFTGRLSVRRLAPGRYRLIAAPTADRRRGDAKHARFRIRANAR
jgi:uncharacterized delta-60 repeat protein